MRGSSTTPFSRSATTSSSTSGSARCTTATFSNTRRRASSSRHRSSSSSGSRAPFPRRCRRLSRGIGLAYPRVRSLGSLIESTNGLSSGIVPWLKTLDASVAAVNQGGKRKGACCVYLEPWHADVEEFLALRDNTGDEASRTHNLNLANWIPDLFMRRVEADGDWSLFDPKLVPALPDLFGEAFEQAYMTAEQAGLAAKTVKARELYARMMRTLAQTGNGWMTFKDRSNRACNQTADARSSGKSGSPGRTVHLSNLCT